MLSAYLRLIKETVFFVILNHDKVNIIEIHKKYRRHHCNFFRIRASLIHSYFVANRVSSENSKTLIAFM